MPLPASLPRAMHGPRLQVSTWIGRWDSAISYSQRSLVPPPSPVPISTSGGTGKMGRLAGQCKCRTVGKQVIGDSARQVQAAAIDEERQLGHRELLQAFTVEAWRDGAPAGDEHCRRPGRDRGRGNDQRGGCFPSPDAGDRPSAGEFWAHRHPGEFYVGIHSDRKADSQQARPAAPRATARFPQSRPRWRT